MNNDVKIYLASKSPRRKKLLKQIGIKFSTFSVDIEEKQLPNETPVRTVKRLAEEKLNAALKIKSDGVIITADTIVVLDGQIIGKPKSKKDARSILKKLSGAKHFVYTGFAVFNSQNTRKILGYRKTAVTFRELSEKEIAEYVATGSPLDKAGAYGIQDDYGAVFVKNISGCYYNVVGLPLVDVYLALREVLND